MNYCKACNVVTSGPTCPQCGCMASPYPQSPAYRAQPAAAPSAAAGGMQYAPPFTTPPQPMIDAQQQQALWDYAQHKVLWDRQTERNREDYLRQQTRWQQKQRSQWEQQVQMAQSFQQQQNETQDKIAVVQQLVASGTPLDAILQSFQEMVGQQQENLMLSDPRILALYGDIEQQTAKALAEAPMPFQAAQTAIMEEAAALMGMANTVLTDTLPGGPTASTLPGTMVAPATKPGPAGSIGS